MYLFIVSALPVIILCLYIFLKDKNKEPKRLLIKLFVLGMLSCIPAFFLELFIIGTFDDYSNNFWYILCYSFLGVALIEELCKYFITYFVTYKHKEFDEIYDMIVYSAFVSLGFAFLENICYVYLYGYMTGLFRAILSVPFHACNGVFMGYYLGLAKSYAFYNNKSLERKNKIMSLAMAILSHGFYDFCIFSGNLLAFIIFVIYVICMYLYCIKRINSVSKSGIKIK